MSSIDLNNKEHLILLIVAGLLLFYIFTYTNKERFLEMFTTLRNFTGLKPLVTPQQYFQDIRVLSSYVGPYIGEIYLYLRGKYFDPVLNKSLPPYYKPEDVSDPTLGDPLLPIARTQIKSWIDTSKLRLLDRYGEEFIKKYSEKSDIYYTESASVLKVTYIENGKSSTYLI